MFNDLDSPLDNAKLNIEQNIANVFNQKRDENNHGIVICGHRGGALGLQPDNTLAAFKHAIDIGVPMIEFDVSKFRNLFILIGFNFDNIEFYVRI